MTPLAQPIRVLHITSVEASNYLLNTLVDYSNATEVEFAAATLAEYGTFAKELQRRGVHVRALGARSRRAYPNVLRQIASIVRYQRIDLIHSHLFEPSLLAAWAAKRLGVAFVVTRHHSDAVHRLRPPARRWAYRLLEGFVMRRADRIIAPARMVRDVLTRIEHIAPDRVALVPYPQDAARYDSVQPEDVRQVRLSLGMEGRTNLVFVARLHPEKGHQVLFDALPTLLREHPGLRVYLVGAGDERIRLEAYVRRLGIEAHVAFLGWREDALTILAAAELVVHPSLHEALPSAVIEAVALCRPVVASDVSGVRDILNDGAHGRIVPPGDVGELQRGIRETLSDLRSAREKAERGREFVLSYMDPSRVAAAHMDCYRTALSAHDAAAHGAL